ncbi:MAG TPA: Asp-tRNA(Asn)/Glu-tRNA(Gln) amidotransferase subunit GatB [Gaiellaceae bacterium]|jgi:aspartyl-tRNA(Asn)/glutamyl-tRNA(Gln) amidotransferase subunit B
MTQWEAVVGLEIHVQLKTRTKMFCRCETGFGAPPNTHTCPVCLAHPGALPVPNRKAVEWTIRLGLALGSEIAERAVFARKNYFYPDNPKGYQISQYDQPLCVGGSLAVPGVEPFEIGFVRAHLEEDAAKTVHVGGGTGRKIGAERSLIDFNRGGTPLVEIVAQPDIRSAEQAERFLQLLRQTIVALGISDARMEEGTLRCDANVSVRPAGSDELRTRWELKNMNSFRYIGRGIDAAVRAQVALYESGEEVEQHTYDYEPETDTLTPHRSKEEADDYRYFAEPDLVPVEPAAALVERLRADLPLLPADAIRARAEALGVEDAWALVTTDRDPAYLGLVAGGVSEREAYNFTMNQSIPAGADLGELVKVAKAAKELTREALSGAVAASADAGFSADAYLGQRAVSDTGELEPLVDAVLAAHPGQVEAYRGGKDGLLGFFVGQVMKETGGRANPKVVNELLREKLAS